MTAQTKANIHMSEPLLHALDNVRHSVNIRTNRVERSNIGQFLTPTAIGCFMASLFEQNRQEQVRILDAGAGAGVLFSAAVEALIGGSNRPLSYNLILTRWRSLRVPLTELKVARESISSRLESILDSLGYGREYSR